MPTGKRKKYARVRKIKKANDSEDPKIGEFHFGWEAILFKPGSKRITHAKVKSMGIQYQSGKIAFDAGVKFCESLGYTMLTGGKSKWEN